MKIVLISKGYDYEFPHPACGGAEACTEKTAINLARQNYNPTVICAKRQVKTNHTFEIIETEAIPERYHIGSNYQEEAADIAMNLKPDLVLAENFHWKLNNFKCPVFVSLHGGGDGIIGESNDRNDNVHYRFISQTQMDRCIKNKPELGKNSFLCYTALLDEDFIFQPKGEYFLWCASLFWGLQAKGLDMFIQLSSLYPEYEFFAYGMGDEQMHKYLKEQVEPNFPNFKFKGFLDRYKNHNEVFSKAIALCHFSRLQETFSRSTLEALSKGVPVIHFNSGSIPEQVQDHGILVESNQQLIESIEESQKINRKKVFEYSKKFHADEEIKTIINYYNKVK